MKTERRHDLQHNVLDSELGKILGFFRKHGNQLFWAFMIGAAVILLVVFARTKAHNRELETRNRFDHLRADGEMDIEERIGAWAELADSSSIPRLAGQSLVAGGDDNQTMFAKVAGNEQIYLDEAERLYRRAIAEFSDHPGIVAKAHLGLSGVAKNRGDLETAGKELQAVLDMKEMQGRPVALEAERLKELLSSLEEPVTMVYETTPLTEILEGTVDPFAPYAEPGPTEGQPGSEFFVPGRP